MPIGEFAANVIGTLLKTKGTLSWMPFSGFNKTAYSVPAGTVFASAKLHASRGRVMPTVGSAFMTSDAEN
eukprot:1151857-Pelagomonas_calceolata.AAC.1